MLNETKPSKYAEGMHLRGYDGHREIQYTEEGAEGDGAINPELDSDVFKNTSY